MDQFCAPIIAQIFPIMLGLAYKISKSRPSNVEHKSATMGKAKDVYREKADRRYKWLDRYTGSSSGGMCAASQLLKRMDSCYIVVICGIRPSTLRMDLIKTRLLDLRRVCFVTKTDNDVNKVFFCSSVNLDSSINSLSAGIYKYATLSSVGICGLLHVISWPFRDIVSTLTVVGHSLSLVRWRSTLCQLICETPLSAQQLFSGTIVENTPFLCLSARLAH